MQSRKTESPPRVRKKSRLVPPSAIKENGRHHGRSHCHGLEYQDGTGRRRGSAWMFLGRSQNPADQRIQESQDGSGLGHVAACGTWLGLVMQRHAVMANECGRSPSISYGVVMIQWHVAVAKGFGSSTAKDALKPRRALVVARSGQHPIQDRAV